MRAMAMLDRIRSRRNELGYTQYDVGQRLGYESANGYHQLETGKVKMTIDKLLAIADMLKLPMKELI